uniref:Uncharacterized protein n=1 Tax=Setaria digitata TaxID=48799 RepID=A0A915Q876_9BILA
MTPGWFTLLTLHGFVCLTQQSNKITYAKLFGTKQFLFVTLSKCHLTVEQSPASSACPYHTITYFSGLSNQSSCQNLQLHLILRNRELPKVLILGATRVFGSLIGQQLQIPWPRKKSTSSAYVFEKIHINLESSYNYVGRNLPQQQVLATLVDSEERMLYVLRNITLADGSFILECSTFYIQFTSDDRLIFYELSTFRNIHPNNNDRILWTEDSYRRQFYYVEKRKDQVILYSMHFSDIMQAFLNGISGTVMRIFTDTELYYLRVSRGIAVIHASERGNVKQFITSLDDSLTITCNKTTWPILVHPSTTMILLFDNELCSLQEANGSNCTANDKGDVDNTLYQALRKLLTYLSKDQKIILKSFTTGNYLQIL